MNQKETLHRYLRREREDLLAKLDGLSERDVRWPVTRTGTNLLGLVKHTASVQADYFGLVFDRPSGIELPWMDDDAEVNADMWATAKQSREEIIALHHASAAHSDATIEALHLDAPGRVPWWGDHGAVTLHQILVHCCVETARHGGHADIIREVLDGQAGGGRNSVPDQSNEQWTAYRDRLEAVANGFSRLNQPGRWRRNPTLRRLRSCEQAPDQAHTPRSGTRCLIIDVARGSSRSRT